jgi:HEAT repeat protein
MRSIPAIAALFLLALCAGPSLARDDEPSLAGKTLSEWLTMLREDKNPDHRRAALLALERIGPQKSRKIVPAIIVSLREDSEEKVRAAAAVALGRIAGKARADKDDDLRLEPIRDALAAALRTDQSGRVREAAATGLGRLEGDARAVVGTLALALKDTHPGTRTAAADALRRMGKDAREALPELQQVLADKNADRLTRIQAALALGRIGPPDARSAVPVLRDVLADTRAHPELRKAAAETLGQFGPDAVDAVPALAAALSAKDSPLALRRAAAGALDQLGPDAQAALDALVAAVSGSRKDDDKYVRSLSLHAIARIRDFGPKHEMVITALLTAVDDNVIEVRIAAIDALASLGAEGLRDQAKTVAARLTEVSRDSQKVVAEAAQEALKKINKGSP